MSHMKESFHIIDMCHQVKARDLSLCLSLSLSLSHVHTHANTAFALSLTHSYVT